MGEAHRAHHLEPWERHLRMPQRLDQSAKIQEAVHLVVYPQILRLLAPLMPKLDLVDFRRLILSLIQMYLVLLEEQHLLAEHHLIPGAEHYK